MEQVVDLQNSTEFKELGVEIVSIARDPAEEQAPAARELGIQRRCWWTQAEVFQPHIMY